MDFDKYSSSKLYQYEMSSSYQQTSEVTKSSSSEFTASSNYSNGIEPRKGAKQLAPHFIVVPSAKVIDGGKTVRIDCRVGGTPIPNVTWFHGDRQLNNDNSYKILVGENGLNTLMISLSSTKDGGDYMCLAKNEHGVSRFDIKLNITDKMISAAKSVTKVESIRTDQSNYRADTLSTKPIMSKQKDEQMNSKMQANEGSIYIQQTAKDTMWSSNQAVLTKENTQIKNKSKEYNSSQKPSKIIKPQHEVEKTQDTKYQRTTDHANKNYYETSTSVYSPKPVKTKQPENEKQKSETIYLRHIERPVAHVRLDDDDSRYKATKPAFTTNIHDLILNEDERALFEARLIPIGDPHLIVEWFFNGKPLEASSRILASFNFGYVSLTVLKITLEDAGIYTCRAINEAGEAITTATLNVRPKPIIDKDTIHPDSLETIRHLEDYTQYQRQESIEESFSPYPPMFVKHLNNIDSVGENGYIHLEAQIKPVNDPTMKIEWYFNHKVLNASSRISTINSCGYVALNISNARATDSGIYVCKAKNARGEAISTCTVKVKGSTDVTYETGIEEQQEFIKQTQQLEEYYRRQYHSEVIDDAPTQAPYFKVPLKNQHNIQERRTAHFEAALEPQNDSNLKVEWYKDGNPLEASSRITTFFNFGYVSLTIKDVEARDTGTYTCVATNTKGTAQSSADLTVISKKSIIVEPQYEQGWEKVQHMEDSSKYRREEFEEIEINQKPTFTSTLSGHENYTEGQSAHFETRLEPMGDPTMKVEWFFNGKPLTTGHRFKNYFDFGYVALDILYVFPEDSGLLTVKAKNKLGEAVLSKQILVQSKSAIDTSTIHQEGMEQIRYLEREHKEPEYIIDESSKIRPYFVVPLSDTKKTYNEGEKIHLECRVEPVNDSSLTVEWFFNGKQLKTGHRFQTHFDFGYISLDILDLFIEDSGEYTVRVQNQLGSAHSSVCINVVGKKRVITEAQYPDGMEQIRNLEDSSRYKREEFIETTATSSPKFVKPLHNVETVEGTNVHLECRLIPSGDNDMKVEWFRNGISVPVGHRFRPQYDFDYVALDLLGVYAEDSGVYTCKAKNSLGEAVTSCNVKIYSREPNVIKDSQHPEAFQQIKYLEDSSRYKREIIMDETITTKPRFITKLKNVLVNEGQIAHFECRIEPVNDPKVKVEWFHNGKQLMIGSRFQPFHDFGYVSLNILHCIEEDSGQYVCKISNDLGTDETSVELKVISKAKIDLSSLNPEGLKRIRELEDYSRFQREEIEDDIVNSAPVFTTAPKSIEIKEGDRAHFECHLTPIGDSNLVVEWYKDGYPVKQGSRFVQLFDFGFVALDIMGAYPEDSGRYTCKATNQFGEAVTSAVLKCHGKSSLITESQLPESYQAIQQLESYKSPKPVQEEEITTQNPVFTQPMSNLELKENQTAHFECRLIPVGDPTLKVEWFHNGIPLMQASRVHSLHDFGFVALDLHQVVPEDSGTFTCKAVNALGSAVCSATLKVTGTKSILSDSQFPIEKINQLESQQKYYREEIHETLTTQKPIFVTPLTGPTQLTEGQSGHFECRIEPFPDSTMKVEWFHNGKTLKLGHRFRTLFDFGFAALDILSLVGEDSGEYTIKASNHLGYATSSINLKVLSKKSIILDSQQPESLDKIRALEEHNRYIKHVEKEVEILEKPMFGRPLYNLENLKEGQSAHLEATLTPLNDPTMKVEWFVNGMPIQQGSRFQTMHDFGYVALDIAYIVPEDSGTYMCKATNKNGEAINTCSIRVRGTDTIETGTLHEQSLQQIHRLESQYVKPVEAPAPEPTRPVFIVPLKSLENIKEGQSAHLECRLEPINDPNLKVEWFVNGVALKTGHRFVTTHDFGYVALDILYSYPNDSGTYMCKATNQLGEAVTTASINVQARKSIYRETLHPGGLEKIQQLEAQSLPTRAEIEEKPSIPPKFISELTGLTEYIEGQAAHFEARIEPTYDSNLKIEFFHNGKPLVSGSRFGVHYEFGYISLDITRLIEEDSGTYTVVATNKLGQAQSSINLKVNARSSIILEPQLPSEMESNERIIQIEKMRSQKRTEITEVESIEVPKFTKELENQPILKEGENAHFEAKLTPTNDPNLRVEWYKNGISLRAGTRIKSVHDFGLVILEISPVYEEDSGVYTCKAINKHGEAITSSMLKVESKRSVILESQLPEGMEGGIERIAQIEEMASSRLTEVIHDTQPTHAPQFLTAPSDLDLQENSLAHFECRLTPIGDPTMKVDWYHNGKTLITGSRVKTISDFGFVILEVAGVYPRDSGVYTCEAVNKYGKASVSCRLNVTSKQSIILEPQLPEQFITGTESIKKLEESLWRTPELIYDQEKCQPPRFVTTLKDLLEKNEGDSAHFECRLEPIGDPYLKVEWFHNGKALTTGTRVHTVNDFGFVVLEIDWLFPRDSGEYFCKATNKYGTDITKAILKVKSKRDIIIETQLPPEFSVDKLRDLDRPLESHSYEEENKVSTPKFITQIQSLENLIEGDPAHFECKLLPSDDPNLRVEWYHNGKPLPSGHRFKTIHDFGFVSLDILYVYPEDSGEYIARAVNQVGEDVTRAIIRCRARQKIIYQSQLPKEMESGVQKIAEMEFSKQRIESTEESTLERMAPMFVMKPESQCVVEGEWAKFCCRVIGYPRPRVMWVLNGNTVINGSRYKLSFDGIYHLDIPRVRQYDMGKIEVYARNLLGEAYCWTTLEVRSRHDDYRAVLKNSPRPWYDQEMTRYQRERKESELDKIFEEKLTPGGTEVERWRTEQLSEDERVKIREHMKEEESLVKPEVKRYTTETMYIDKKSGEPRRDDQSQVSWMAESYQTKVDSQYQPEKTYPESVVHGREVQTKVQRQIQKEKKSDLEVTRKIKTTETLQQEHKGITKERKVIGPPKESKPPIFKKKIQPIRCFEGERATFECHFEGIPVPTITWYRENFAIQNSRDFQIVTTENKSSLTVREVYLEDSGVFSVKAENRVGSAKSSANLVVEERKDHKSGAVPPSFSKTIEDAKVKSGALVRFDARIIGSRPIDVYWLKNGTKMLPGVTHKMVEEDDQNTLLILEANPDDAGTYECVIMNQVGEARCSAKLTVDGPPTTPMTPTTPSGKPPILVEPLKDLNVFEGSQALFRCRITGVTASKVTWYKGDSLIKQSRFFRMGNDRDVFNLRISEAFPEDEGVYKCVATNNIGSISTSARLHVSAPHSDASPPTLTPLQNLIIAHGAPARFVTSLTGWPTPTISWYKDGQLIKPTRDFQMFQDNASCSLVIRQSYPEDEGIYLCRATNDSGQTETSARLTIERKSK